MSQVPTDVRIFQVDAVASRRFAGNSAAVTVLEACPEDAVLGAAPVEPLFDGFNLIAVVDDEAVVRGLCPDFARILALAAPAAPPYDFVSRYFAPYWAGRLGRADLLGFQASRRGGEVRCRPQGARVELEGACVFYLEGRARF